MKNLLRILCTILLLTCAACSKQEAPRQAVSLKAQPNVIFMILDTLRADHLGAYGFPKEVSPELDALASDGVMFSRVVAPSSWTRPSCGAILTGAYPRNMGLYVEVDQALADSFTTLAEAFQNAGFRTIGMTANPHLNRTFNLHQGFDHYEDSTVVYTFMGTKEGESLFNKSKLRPARDMFGSVLEMARAGGDQPHYVQLLLMDVHEWCRGDKKLTRPEFDGQFKGEPFSEYLDAIRQLSHDIGGFVDTLTAVPGWEDTLFVFVSDHGEGLGSHPGVEKSRFHGRLLYESQVRVPWIMYRPGERFANPVVEQQVRLIDVAPTLLSYLDLPVPETADGISVLPLTEGGAVDLPEYFVTETQLRGHDKIAAYGDAWRYIENRDGHKGVPPRELQPAGIAENGTATDVLDEQPDVTEAMDTYLEQWERDHPKAEPTPCEAVMTGEEEEQLRAIGYLD